MTRRIIAAAVLVASAVIPMACQQGKPAVARDSGSGGAPKAPVEIGPALYPAKAAPKEALATSVIDPIVFPAHLTVIDKVEVPSQRDGKLMFIGTEAKPGEKWPADWIFQHPDPDTKLPRTFRRLTAGDHVEKDAIVVMLDDKEAVAEYRIRQAAVLSAKAAVDASVFTVETLKVVLEKTEKLFKDVGGSATELELKKAKLDVQRAIADQREKEAMKTKADEELGMAKVQLEKHYIRSPIAGILQPTNRKAGEAIKAQETVVQIQSKDTLRADGSIPIGYQYRIDRGLEVLIEPSVEVGPDKRIIAHSSPITGVAWSNHDKPLLVTVSEDKTAIAWSMEGENNKVREFKHDVSVRCVACTGGSTTAHLCLTGADDGKGRIWNLDAKDATPRVLEGFTHKGIIHAVAFAPDGKTCVTADARDICLWDVATGQKRYEFPAHHLGDIVSLSYTPQAKLVSASRDNSIAVWSLGDKGANLDMVIDNRSGDVARVGVSHSGRHVLFDTAQSLRVMTIPEKTTVAVMQSTTDAYKFANFAVYSPDDKMILTGTNAEGRLSVWKAPAGGARAAELRQFNPKERVFFTCADIAASSQFPFAAGGTKDGTVYVFTMPSEKEVSVPLRGVITFVDTNADATSHQIRVWADFDNSQAKLSPGSAVTIVVNPQQTKR